MIDTILFDLDGTLMNTLTDITASVNHALTKLKLPVLSEDEVRLTVGHGQHENLLLCLPVDKRDSKTLVEMEGYYSEYYLVHQLDHTMPYPGIISTLQELKKQNIKLAVVSNKGERDVQSICQKTFGDLFTVCIGLSDDVLPKPAPDMLFKALRLLQSDLKETMFVGDCEQDIETGKNTGCLTCGCSWGYRGAQILREEKADYVIDQPSELLNLIDKAV